MARRTLLVLGSAVVLAAAVGSSAVAGSGRAAKALVAPGSTPSTITVVERALTDAVVDIGPANDSLGDILAFGNPVYNAANTNHVGRDQGSCVRTRVGIAWECSWTVLLQHGHLTVQGPFLDSGEDSLLSVTGGTGWYKAVTGQMRLHARNAQGTAYDFVFDIRY